MARTLLDIVGRDFAVPIDADSDGGQILNSLTLDGALNPELGGKAHVNGLTLSLGPRGVRVRAAQTNDAMVFSPSDGDCNFTIVPPAPGQASFVVEIELVAPKLKLPFLHPAAISPDGTLDRLPSGDVQAVFPKLLLVVVATSGTSAASAKLAPSHDAAEALEVSFEPPHVVFGAGEVLGFKLPRATLNLDTPGGGELRFPEVMVFVEPPGVPALCMRGTGQGLVIDVGGTGITGDLQVVAASGEFARRRPRFIRDLAARVSLLRNSVRLFELTGRIELSAEIGRHLGASIEEGPGDVTYRLALALDGGWTTSLKLSSSGGRNYLWRSKRGLPHERERFRDTLGAYSVFAPLLAPELSGVGSSGYVDLGLSAAAAAGIAENRWITAQLVTVMGAELNVTSLDGVATESVLLLDVETELSLDAHVGGSTLIRTLKPLKVRQKAVGIKLDFGPDGNAPRVSPVFDPLQGFSLDLSDPGTFEIPGPLGEFLQPDAVRVARDNPLVFEVDLITKVDLGIVTIDQASIRVPLDNREPTLTELGAHLDMGVVVGDGHIRILKSGLSAGFDASLAALGVRVGADLQIETEHPVTHEKLISVLIGIDAEWPIPVPLANSGVGLFGILGLLATNRRRQQPRNQTALDWYVEAGGSPRNGSWEVARGDFALGLGAVLGTVEGGFLINAKGMVMIELPGPRLMLMMNASIMQARPPKEGAATGSLLAVIEISPDAISIGIIAEYSMKFLIELRVPVDVRFDLRSPSNWQFDLGSIEVPRLVSVRFMSSIRANGYFMIHGDGIASPLHQLNGFSVAAGIQAAITWGPVDIGLYIKVAVGADVAIGFKPAVMIGRITLEGELHLFIVSLGVRASTLLRITDDSFHVRARIEGHVDFFLFEVSGGVTFELGDPGLTLPDAEPLLRAVSLHGRTHALLPGSGAGQEIDGSLGEASTDLGGPTPIVPIDAIPVLQFEMRPHVREGVTFLGRDIPSMLGPTGWVQRGERFYRYEVKSVRLTAAGADDPVEKGDTPVVWWDRQGNPAAHDDSDVQLALLDWIPDPTPAAALRTQARDAAMLEKWGTVCSDIAKEASVFWTFQGKASGASASGWTLVGTPWPDPPGTIRSSPPPVILKVTEPWRTGTIADSLVRVGAAFVIGPPSARIAFLVPPSTGRDLLPRVAGDGSVKQLLALVPPADLRGLADAIRLDTHGMRGIKGLYFVQQPISFAVGVGRRLVIRGLDPDGQDMGFRTSTEATAVSFSQLPDRWNEPGSPWAPMVSAFYDAFPAETPFCFFDIELPEGTASVEIGIDYSPQEEVLRRYWFLFAVEVEMEAEYARRSFDEHRKTVRTNTINGALGADQSKRALLRPNTDYSVAIDYDVSTVLADSHGNPDLRNISGPVPRTSKVFRFKTDDAPPDSLEHLIMGTAPGQYEEAFFHADPIRVVFSTGETRKLFKAYGHELFAVVSAASGKHPRTAPGVDPGTVALNLAPVGVTAIAALAMTPFEDSARTSLNHLHCIDLEFANNRHEMLTFSLPLEPMTGYVLDIEAHRIGEPPEVNPLYPLMRRFFRTSRYASAEAFARDVLNRAFRHRHLPDVSALAALPAGSVHDLTFEAALRAARWGEFGKAREPRVTVIWHGPPPSQPFAVLIETPEQQWRSRSIPERQSRDGVTFFGLGTQQWLEVISQSGVGVFSHFVRSTDGSRTLAVLLAGARGKTLTLFLQRNDHPLYEGSANHQAYKMVDIGLVAPWETGP